MKAKQWPRRRHNTPNTEDEKDVESEVEADRRAGKEPAEGISRGGGEQEDTGYSRTRKNTFTLPKRCKMKPEKFSWGLGKNSQI